jgi:serine O-acetyltransferase
VGALERRAAQPVALDLWDEIDQVAARQAQAEPMLARRLELLVLSQPTPAAKLAAILARQLACDDLPFDQLQALALHSFAADPLIVRQVDADLLAVRTRDPACPDALHVLLNGKGFHALQTYRVAHALYLRGRVALAHALANRSAVVFAVDIHPAARIGCGVMLDHASGIVIGETTVIDDDVSILQNVTLGGTGKEQGDRHPKIGMGVMIGAGATVLGNIQIGAMSKIAAGSVVLRSVPAHCTVAGIPAVIVRIHEANKFPSFEMNQMI